MNIIASNFTYQQNEQLNIRNKINFEDKARLNACDLDPLIIFGAASS